MTSGIFFCWSFVFNLEQAGFVTLKIYDILGNEVAVLVRGNLEKGIHEVDFNA